QRIDPLGIEQMLQHATGHHADLALFHKRFEDFPQCHRHPCPSFTGSLLLARGIKLPENSSTLEGLPPRAHVCHGAARCPLAAPHLHGTKHGACTGGRSKMALPRMTDEQSRSDTSCSHSMLCSRYAETAPRARGSPRLGGTPTQGWAR